MENYRLYINDLSGIDGQINSFSFRVEDGKKQVSTDGVNWENFSGGEEPVLIWTNPSPTASFPAQTIGLDLSDYDAVLVETRYSTSNEYKEITFINEKVVPHKASVMVHYRDITINDNSITFGIGINENWSATANDAIPTRIWGIKGNIIISVGTSKKFNVNTYPYVETLPSKAKQKVIVQFHANSEAGGLIIFTYDVNTGKTTYSWGAIRDDDASSKYGTYITITDSNITVNPPNGAWMGDIWDYFYA